jgi:hypothetical protein
MSPQPSDARLYERVKRSVYRQHPRHSAYRSGLVVQAYKRAFRNEYGSRRSPYRGRRPSRTGLSRWYKEKWSNQRGEVGYRYASDVYRPTRRVTARTPLTFRQLSRARISSARRQKARSGRVRRF